jgi:MoxR-like ATPase
MSQQDQTSERVHYVADEGLRAAVEVAIDLQLPLLVTGEPGTGKTRLAYWVAEEILKTKVLIFNTKTTTAARDLFYRYDAVRHFREAQTRSKDLSVNTLDYIHFGPLGQAILASARQRYVVLIDEIDKAPRDVPNDILFEFQELAFRIEEANLAEYQNYRVGRRPELAGLLPEDYALAPDEQGFLRHAPGRPKPFLVLTSNSEKNLPDAFLRRCVFYHIPFPDSATLAEIVRKNVALTPAYDAALDTLIERFKTLRESGLRKKPATDELNKWIDILQRRGIDPLKLDAPEVRGRLLATFPVLAKNRDDLDKLKGLQYAG